MLSVPLQVTGLRQINRQTTSSIELVLHIASLEVLSLTMVGSITILSNMDRFDEYKKWSSLFSCLLPASLCRLFTLGVLHVIGPIFVQFEFQHSRALKSSSFPYLITISEL